MTTIVGQALARAMELHDGQMRKDGVTPYIAHPIQAALLLARAGCDDETIAAGLLHDTIEDTPYRPEHLREEFGTRIAEIVEACSENKAICGWEERKEELFARLKTASQEAKRVKAADALANMMDLTTALARTHGDFWGKFCATPQQKMDYFQAVLDLTHSALPSALKCTYKQVLDNLRREHSRGGPIKA